MRKIISMLLMWVMVLSAFAAYAKDSDKMQEVLLSVKSRIGSTDEFKKFDSSVSERNGTAYYSFFWENHESNPNKSINITATESGLITDYYCYDGSSSRNSKPNFNQISVEEAAIRTKTLIDKLNPGAADKIAVISEGVTQNLYNNGFSFSLQRYENGIKVYNNTGYVRVNADATEIQNYNLTYDESISFPSSDSVIKKEEAQKIYGEKIGMTLEYRASYDYESKARKVIPVYIPVKNDKYINAVTGDIEEFVYNDSTVFNAKNAAMGSGGAVQESAKADGVRMSEAEISEFENLEGLKSKDELLKIVKENPYTSISDDMVLSWYNTSKSYYEELYTAALSFEKNADTYEYANVTLNMETGEILSFYKDKEMSVDKTAKISEDEIKAIKEKAVSDLAGEKGKEYRYDEESKRYIRYVNDIPFRSDSINVSVSEFTGEVRSYNISYSNMEFPRIDGVITRDVATSQLFSQVQYEYLYAKMNYMDTEAKIIYMLDERSPATVDAFSGKLLGYENEEYVSEIFEGYSDISGHYAESIVNTLAKFGIYFEGKELKPDEAIKQKDFIALLVSTFKSGNTIILKEAEAYKNEYSRALRENILMPEEENPDELVTRELAAKYMIRAMEAEEIANIPDIYICPFNDVYSLKGHIAILNGLKIINGDGSGSFYPEKTLTRADALIMIYNYLSR